VERPEEEIDAALVELRGEVGELVEVFPVVDGGTDPQVVAEGGDRDAAGDARRGIDLVDVAIEHAEIGEKIERLPGEPGDGRGFVRPDEFPTGTNGEPGEWSEGRTAASPPAPGEFPRHFALELARAIEFGAAREELRVERVPRVGIELVDEDLRKLRAIRIAESAAGEEITADRASADALGGLPGAAETEEEAVEVAKIQQAPDNLMAAPQDPDRFGNRQDVMHVEEKSRIEGVARPGARERQGGGLVRRGVLTFFVSAAKRGLRGHVRSVSSGSFRCSHSK
jgi:hypothetical protein